MKYRNIFFAMMMFLNQSSFSQEKNYNGSFVAGEDAGSISANSIKIRTTDKSFSAVLHLRLNAAFQVFKDKRDHSNDYTDISGNCQGTVTDNILESSFTLAVVENETGIITKNNPPAKIKATISGSEIKGQLIVGEEDPTILSFSAIAAGNEKPELTYPSGKSPKIFDKGWLFGASFSLLNEKGELMELSDKVEWSGTASFSPATGKESRPVFNNIGPNKIILTVKYEGNTYKNEYQVEVVSHLLYGHIGSITICQADQHGCPACPHYTIGSISSGSSVIRAGDYPASRVGDRGVTAGCCGGNYFTITTGDDYVLIEGKPAARIGMSETRHCGGSGIVAGGYSDMYLWENEGGIIYDGQGKTSEKKEIVTGDVLKTDMKGLFGFPGNNQTAITLFPNSLLKILEQTKEKLRLLLEKGHLLVNGNSDAFKKILVDLKNFSITPSGTRFLIFTDSLGTVTINVYEGKISIRHLTDGTITDVDSGYSFRYTGKSGSVESLETGTESRTMRELMSAVDNKTAKIIYDKEPPAGTKDEKQAGGKKSFIQKNLLYIAGGGLLVIILLILGMKRKKSQR